MCVRGDWKGVTDTEYIDIDRKTHGFIYSYDPIRIYVKEMRVRFWFAIKWELMPSTSPPIVYESSMICLILFDYCMYMCVFVCVQINPT